MSLAVTAAVTCEALTNVVLRDEPFHCTVAPDTKPLPFTVRVNAGPPAVALFGNSDDSVGAAGGAFTVNVNAFDAVLPGFTAVT